MDETRPLLQGARLTAWELLRLGIPHRLVTDSMVGALMSRGLVERVIVGADRIAANGDAANKIGTYTVAVLAQRHKVPFYVAAPLSTFDPRIASGAEIPIEERAGLEVTELAGRRIAPVGTAGFNLAFDVTPAELITAIVTEEGVLEPPFTGRSPGCSTDPPPDGYSAVAAPVSTRSIRPSTSVVIRCPGSAASASSVSLRQEISGSSSSCWARAAVAGGEQRIAVAIAVAPDVVERRRAVAPVEVERREVAPRRRCEP